MEDNKPNDKEEPKPGIPTPPTADYWTPCIYNGLEYQVGSRTCINGQIMECSIQGMWFPTGDVC